MPTKCLQLLALSDLGCSQHWLMKLHSAVGSSWYRLTAGQRTESKGLCTHPYQRPPPWRHRGKGGETSKLEDGEECWDILSPGPYSRCTHKVIAAVVACTRSNQPNPQHLQKASTLTEEEMLSGKHCWGKDGYSFLDVVTGRFPMLHWMVPHPYT